MKYDFDEIIDRRGTNCVKWDSAENPAVLPMWVADMDFRAAPAIIDALRRRWTTVYSVIPVCRKVTMTPLRDGSHAVMAGT